MNENINIEENEFENSQQTLSGAVIFRKIDIGSKSESVQPFLYINQNQVIHIFKENSNPFENDILHQYDGKFVTLKGSLKENTFVIEEIL